MLFLHFDGRTWRTADNGRTWSGHGWMRDSPKGPVSDLAGGRFTATRTALYLGNGSGVLAYAFDAAAGDWKAFPAGSGVLAAAGDGDRLYAYTADGILRVTPDGGASWARVDIPESMRLGAYFDQVRAEGPIILVSNRNVTASGGAIATRDAGATWMRFPAGTATGLGGGCLYEFESGRLRMRCAPAFESADLAGAPFDSARALFADRQGNLFARTDSALFVCHPTPGVSLQWGLFAGGEALRGWTLSGGTLWRLEAGRFAWISLEPSGATGLSSPLRRGPSVRASQVPAWILRGRKPDGRAMKRPR